MPNSADIDEALVTRLLSDPALQALMPDGVYFDEAPGGKRRFVVLMLVSEEDHATFGWREYEDALYRIQAVALDIVSDSASAAAGRIDALLENQALVVTGFSWMATHRERRFRHTQPDAVDTSLRWQVSGGEYRVQMAPLRPAAKAEKERTS